MWNLNLSVCKAINASTRERLLWRPFFIHWTLSLLWWKVLSNCTLQSSIDFLRWVFKVMLLKLLVVTLLNGSLSLCEGELPATFSQGERPLQPSQYHSLFNLKIVTSKDDSELTMSGQDLKSLLPPFFSPFLIFCSPLPLFI